MRVRACAGRHMKYPQSVCIVLSSLAIGAVANTMLSRWHHTQAESVEVISDLTPRATWPHYVPADWPYPNVEYRKSGFGYCVKCVYSQVEMTKRFDVTHHLTETAWGWPWHSYVTATLGHTPGTSMPGPNLNPARRNGEQSANIIERVAFTRHAAVAGNVVVMSGLVGPLLLALGASMMVGVRSLKRALGRGQTIEFCEPTPKPRS